MTKLTMAAMRTMLKDCQTRNIALQDEALKLRSENVKLEAAGNALGSFARTDCWEMWFVNPDGAEARGRELAQAWQEAKDAEQPAPG